MNVCEQTEHFSGMECLRASWGSDGFGSFIRGGALGHVPRWRRSFLCMVKPALRTNVREQTEHFNGIGGLAISWWDGAGFASSSSRTSAPVSSRSSQTLLCLTRFRLCLNIRPQTSHLNGSGGFPTLFRDSGPFPFEFGHVPRSSRTRSCATRPSQRVNHRPQTVHSTGPLFFSTLVRGGFFERLFPGDTCGHAPPRSRRSRLCVLRFVFCGNIRLQCGHWTGAVGFRLRANSGYSSAGISRVRLVSESVGSIIWSFHNGPAG